MSVTFYTFSFVLCCFKFQGHAELDKQDLPILMTVERKKMKNPRQRRNFKSYGISVKAVKMDRFCTDVNVAGLD